MQIDPSDIKEARPFPPHSIQLTLKSKKTLVVNVKDWINADSLHQTLLDPAMFIEGYKSASAFVRAAILRGKGFEEIVMTLQRNQFSKEQAKSLVYYNKQQMVEHGVIL